MSASELPEPTAPTAADDASPEANGTHAPAPDPRREEFLLRVQIAKLRHWCRDILPEDRLPPAVARDLAEHPPEMTFDEVLDGLRLHAHGEPLPASFIPTGPARLAGLTAERERLRRTFFDLYEIAFPDDGPPTEEEIRRQMQHPPGRSIEDIIAAFQAERDR